MGHDKVLEKSIKSLLEKPQKGHILLTNEQLTAIAVLEIYTKKYKRVKCSKCGFAWIEKNE